jgi:Carboxypeptidase regulatory-like domain
MFQKTTLIKLVSSLFALLILLQFACKKTDDITPGPPALEPPVLTNDAVKVTATITGSVIDENNKPVANATVTSDTYTSSTDAMGNFSFKNINISAANGHVTVIKSGYFKGIRSFVTEAGKNNFVKIQLVKQIVAGTFTAATGGTANVSGGAIISFPANAFVTAGGAAYTGAVKVYATFIDPTLPNLPLVVPGDLRGINSSNGEYLLKSYGMVGAEIQDNSGNSLKIAPGKTASITFPIPTSLQATAPQSIPLWHFDEAAARWKEDGTATKTGNTYTAQVNKFSFWNVDVPGNFINLDMRLINGANNLPLANTLVKVTSLATNTYAYDHTNDSGFVSGYVPKNENLKLEVLAGTACNSNTVVHTQNIGPYTANTSLGNISVTVPANLVINFTGTIKDCNNLPVSNGYISLSLANSTSTIAYTNATGLVNFSLVHCGGTTTYTYNAVDLATGSYSSTATGTATGNAVNLGTITACGNTINTSGVYIAGLIANDAVLWKDGIATFLTNLPSSNPNKYAYAVKTLVNGNDVYVLGDEVDSTVNGYVSIIKLWKNGVLTNITNGTTEASAYSMDVYNGDVYICGTERTGNNAQISKVWKNGIATVLPVDTFVYGEPAVIKVVNGDVYVSGTLTADNYGTGMYPRRALYWKNGVMNLLPNAQGVNASATGLFINNGDIYLSGYEDALNQNARGVYWKNGIKTYVALSAPHNLSDPYFMFVDNNDVYIAGNLRYQDPIQNIYYSNGCFWKNNNINLLTNYSTTGNNADMYDVFVKNNIVYTVGELYGSNNGVISPLYFQNNVPIPLTGFTNTQDASAYSIFVK